MSFYVNIMYKTFTSNSLMLLTISVNYIEIYMLTPGISKKNKGKEYASIMQLTMDKCCINTL